MDNTIKIYINNHYIKSVDINKKSNINKLIKKAEEKYKIKLDGYLKITIHKGKNYGIIIEIKKEAIDYFDCFNIEIESDIEIIEETFLYQVDDFFEIEDIKDYQIYSYKGEIYLEPKNNIEKIIERVKIIYGKKAKYIREKAQIIKAEVITCIQLP